MTQTHIQPWQFTGKYQHRLIHYAGHWAVRTWEPHLRWHPVNEKQIRRWLAAEGYDVDVIIRQCRIDYRITDFPLRFYNCIATGWGFPMVLDEADMRPLPMPLVGVKP